MYSHIIVFVSHSRTTFVRLTINVHQLFQLQSFALLIYTVPTPLHTGAIYSSTPTNSLSDYPPYLDYFATTRCHGYHRSEKMTRVHVCTPRQVRSWAFICYFRLLSQRIQI